MTTQREAKKAIMQREYERVTTLERDNADLRSQLVQAEARANAAEARVYFLESGGPPPMVQKLREVQAKLDVAEAKAGLADWMLGKIMVREPLGGKPRLELDGVSQLDFLERAAKAGIEEAINALTQPSQGEGVSAEGGIVTPLGRVNEGLIVMPGQEGSDG